MSNTTVANDDFDADAALVQWSAEFRARLMRDMKTALAKAGWLGSRHLQRRTHS